jgi:hypothetical protein
MVATWMIPIQFLHIWRLSAFFLLISCQLRCIFCLAGEIRSRVCRREMMVVNWRTLMCSQCLFIASVATQIIMCCSMLFKFSTALSYLPTTSAIFYFLNIIFSWRMHWCAFDCTSLNFVCSPTSGSQNPAYFRMLFFQTFQTLVTISPFIGSNSPICISHYFALQEKGIS